MHKLVKKEVVNGVIITEPDKYGTHISRIDLTFTKQDGKLVLKDKTATAIPVKMLMEQRYYLILHLKKH